MKIKRITAGLLSALMLAGYALVPGAVPRANAAAEAQYIQPELPVYPRLPDGALEAYSQSRAGRLDIPLAGSADDTYLYYINYGRTAAELSEQEKAINSIISGIDPSWSTIDKILYVNDYLAINCEYDLTFSLYDAYDILIKKTGVCQAYSNAFWLIMDKLGIDCKIVESRSLNHAWNLVKVNGNWYHIDVTWNDPIPNTPGYAGHTYFLVSDPRMKSAELKHFDEDDWALQYEKNVPASSLAPDTSYDGAFWKNVKAAVIINGGKYYYSASGGIYSNSVSGAETKLVDLSSVVWPFKDKPGYYWSGTFSGCGSFNGRIYYNDNDEVLSCKFDGSDIKSEYKLTSQEYAAGSIYNCFTIDNKLYYYVASSPNSSDGTLKEMVLGEAVKPETGLKIDETSFPDEVFRKYVSENFDKDGNGCLSDNEIAAVTSIKLYTDDVESLKGIEIFTALKELFCCGTNGLNTGKDPKGKLAALDVSSNTDLERLDCYNNKLTALNVSGCTKLISLSCDHNELTSIDVSENTKLKYINCYNNELTSIDVSKNTALKGLNCSDNGLASLDVSKNTLLEALQCGSNKLNSIDISKNKLLIVFVCGNNNIKTLNAENNTLLNTLFCSENGITELNLSKNTKLKALNVDRSVVLYVASGSFAEDHASKNGMKYVVVDAPAPDESITVYRLYNSVNREHLFTTDTNEVRVLVKDYGWNYEGSSWSSPTFGIPVYRLYCSATNAHLYTTDTNERDTLLQNPVWSIDNGGEPLFYSDASESHAIYRLYHEGIKRHLLTTNRSEYDALSAAGWNAEGVKFYCSALGDPEEVMP